MTHTPGPWYVMGDDELSEGIPCIEIAYGECPSKMFKQIAYVQPTFHDPDFKLLDEDRANARLIAAAPELLDALQALKGFADVGAVRKHWLDQGEMAAFNKVLIQVGKAIAKATS